MTWNLLLMPRPNPQISQCTQLIQRKVTSKKVAQDHRFLIQEQTRNRMLGLNNRMWQFTRKTKVLFPKALWTIIKLKTQNQYSRIVWKSQKWRSKFLVFKPRNQYHLSRKRVQGMIRKSMSLSWLLNLLRINQYLRSKLRYQTLQKKLFSRLRQALLWLMILDRQAISRLKKKDLKKLLMYWNSSSTIKKTAMVWVICFLKVEEKLRKNVMSSRVSTLRSKIKFRNLLNRRSSCKERYKIL